MVLPFIFLFRSTASTRPRAMAVSYTHLDVYKRQIVNSMQYLVAARKHEFGILRAMGITDAGFRKMLVKEGIRYGVYSSPVSYTHLDVYKRQGLGGYIKVRTF